MILKQKRAWWVLAVIGIVILLMSAFYFLKLQLPSRAPHIESIEAGKRSVKGTDPYIAGPVKNTLRKQAPAIQQLWLAYLKKPDAKDSGSIEIDWRIGSDGNVSHAALIASDIDDPEFAQGLVRLIEQLNFPAPGEAQKYVSHKFIFKKDPL